MTRQLPIVSLQNKPYYLDVRVGQLRSVTTEGPIEFLDLDDLGDEEFDEIAADFRKELDYATKTGGSVWLNR